MTGHFCGEAGRIQGKPGVGAMIKKKTKGMAAKKSAKKTTKKKTTSAKTTTGKRTDPAQVRADIAGMVKSKARGITKAVMAQATNGCLARTKYLFEMAGIYPAATDGSQATQEEDCLAKTLLDRLTPPQKVEGEGAAVSEDEPALEGSEVEEQAGEKQGSGGAGGES
jgi:hypothetical protein